MIDIQMIQIFLQLAIRAHGKNDLLIIPDYREKFSKMPNRAVIWDGMSPDGNDLYIHMEPMDDVLVEKEDILEMEGNVEDDEFE